MNLTYYILIMFLTIIAGCNSSGSSDNNENIDHFVGSSSSSDSASSSSENNTSNLGKNLNSLGYYGEDVYFGDSLLVGNWIIKQKNDNGKSKDFGVNFTQVGDGEMSIYELPTPLHGVIEQYGVDENGSKITYQGTYTNNNALIIFTIEIFDNINQNRCYSMISYSYIYENNNNPTPATTVTYDAEYKLCKLSDLT